MFRGLKYIPFTLLTGVLNTITQACYLRHEVILQPSSGVGLRKWIDNLIHKIRKRLIYRKEEETRRDVAWKKSHDAWFLQ